MTSAQVAKELGITEQYYCMIERGQRQKKMDITLVAGLARVFHLSMEQIVALECGPVFLTPSHEHEEVS